MKDFEKYAGISNLKALISNGEHLQQDFKYKISDARKIARTLSAFSNTEGGRLLIGVRDNGTIGGVKDEDDIYMLESASELFLIPAVPIEVAAYDLDGKRVWEILIPKGKRRPYFVDEKDKKVAYYRDHDQNRVANALILELWRQEDSNESKERIAFTDAERKLIDFLSTYERASVSKAAKILNISRADALPILARLTRWEVLGYRWVDGLFFLCLA
jgi:predicted HTH transcriptional regulator